MLLQSQESIVRLKLPPGFSVCELGEQEVKEPKRCPAKEFYEEIGCGRYVSIDGNGKATVTADLNLPLPDLGQFDLVTDLGTGEHIFDQHQVFRSIHDLTKRKGYIVIDRPHAGFVSSCFYMTNPCLITAIAHANNYSILDVVYQTLKLDYVSILYVMRKRSDVAFRIPQQGRYVRQLVIDPAARKLGPDTERKEFLAIAKPEKRRRPC